jgi:hypothetical protein
MDQLTEYILKGAEAANTYGMPLSAPAGKSMTPLKTVPKTGSINSIVNTTGLNAPRTLATKTAHQYALPNHERYPLDSYTQVKTACAYFEENAQAFDLDMRREFAVNLVKRASDLGIAAPEAALRYGSKVAADPTDLAIAFDGRRGVIEERFHPALASVKEAASSLPPEATALLLREFDQQVGIAHLYGQEILDPYLSAFAKVAEEGGTLKKSPEGSLLVGNDYLSIGDLKRFVSGNRPALVAMYGDETATKFQKDPVGAFNTFPKVQQRVLIRMVNDNGPSGSVND